MLPNFQLSDWVNAFLELLPDWLAFSSFGSVRKLLISAWMGEVQTISEIAVGMPAATFPATTTTVIDNWQDSLNLPDPLIPATTTAEIQNQIVARLTGDITPTPANFALFVANLLGSSVSEITITEYLPFYMNFSRMNVDAFGGDHFHWQVNIPSDYASQISFVTAELNRISPAHTTFTVVA